MPYVKIQSNVLLAEDAGKAMLAEISRVTAETLGKPERYVMVALEPPVPMLFAGSDAPLAYLELKSIGLSDAQTAGLSEALTGVVQRALDVPGDRVYIEFADAPRKMWGWKGGTF